MPTPTPRPNLPSLTAIAASNGALGVLALHALSLHDCIAALDARLAAVEGRGKPDAPTFERIAAAYTKQTLDLCAAQDKIAELARGIDILRADSDSHNRRAAEWQHKVGELTVRAEEAERQRAEAVDKVVAAYRDGRSDAWQEAARAKKRAEEAEAKVAALEGRDSGPADLAAFVKEQAAMEAEVVDLRAKLAGARTAYKMAEEHATQMRVERDAAEAKLTDLTRRRDAEQSCTAPSACVHGVHLRDECDQCLAFNEGVAFGRRSAAVDMEALIAADAKVAAADREAARLIEAAGGRIAEQLAAHPSSPTPATHASLDTHPLPVLLDRVIAAYGRDSSVALGCLAALFAHVIRHDARLVAIETSLHAPPAPTTDLATVTRERDEVVAMHRAVSVRLDAVTEESAPARVLTEAMLVASGAIPAPPVERGGNRRELDVRVLTLRLTAAQYQALADYADRGGMSIRDAVIDNLIGPCWTCGEPAILDARERPLCEACVERTGMVEAPRE